MPIGISRYTCRLSQLTIGHPYRSATRSASSVFPTPVGPSISSNVLKHCAIVETEVLEALHVDVAEIQLILELIVEQEVIIPFSSESR